jgi:hypothetical protein
MSRNDLINRLVARKMAANASAKAGCVPCFGSPARTHCWAPPKKICFAAPGAKKN